MAKATICTHYDGGGGNYIDIPEKDFLDTRTNADGVKEALVNTGGDSGGQNTEWVKVDE